MAVTKELVQSVRSRIAAYPGERIASLASDLNATEAEIITALPLPMRLRARNTAFEAIWNILCRWKRVVIRYADDLARPDTATDGRDLSFFRDTPSADADGDGKGAYGIRPEAVGFIWFVSKPLRDRDSHSIRFLDKEGRHMLSVYIPSDGFGEFDPAAMADYEAMRKSFGVIPVPKHRCRGCGSCNCNAANDAS